MEKKTILILTHLYPRNDGDSIAPFLGTLVENLAKQCNMIVLTPGHKKATKERNGVKLEYFRYFLKSLEDFSYTGSLYSKVRGFKIQYHLLAICFFMGFFIKGLWITLRDDPDILHCHWFVPSGIVGYLISIITGKPLTVTVYSDGYLITESKSLKFLGKIIFNRSKTVVAISKAIKEYIKSICDEGKITVIYPCNRVF